MGVEDRLTKTCTDLQDIGTSLSGGRRALAEGEHARRNGSTADASHTILLMAARAASV